jgi:hypothetical protein
VSKPVDNRGQKRHTSTMTVTADAKNRVTLPSAKPGDEFDVHLAGQGKVVLTKISSVADAPTNVRIEKHGKFSVGVLDHPIDEQALKEALADFP